jgi:hypothetical protein
MAQFTRRQRAVISLALIALAWSIMRALLPNAELPSILELWVALMVLDIYVERAA